MHADGASDVAGINVVWLAGGHSVFWRLSAAGNLRQDLVPLFSLSTVDHNKAAWPPTSLTRLANCHTTIMLDQCLSDVRGVLRQVISTMLRKMPGRLAGAMPEVLAAVVAKLAAAQSSPLITSLLIVLAQLAHADARQLLDFLASQPAPGISVDFETKFSQTALSCLLPLLRVTTRLSYARDFSQVVGVDCGNCFLYVLALCTSDCC